MTEFVFLQVFGDKCFSAGLCGLDVFYTYVRTWNVFLCRSVGTQCAFLLVCGD